MGQFLSQPNTDKESFDDKDETSGICYGVTSMQGWRSGMEDAHLCNLDFDNGRKLFGVFDGHAGPEVAQYLALHLGQFLQKNKLYAAAVKDKKINAKKLGKALTETFMNIDAKLLTDEAIEELEKLSDRKPERGSCDNSDDEQVEARELVSEAQMSLADLMAKYGADVHPDADDSEGNGDASNGKEAKHVQARKHLRAMAQKVGYEIDFGDDDEEEEEEEKKTKAENDEESKPAPVQEEEANVEQTTGRRRKAAKPSKAAATGPVNVSPESESKEATTGEGSSSKTKTSKKEEKSQADDAPQNGVHDKESDGDDDDESEEDYEGSADDDEEGDDESLDSEDEEDEDDEEDGRTVSDFDEDFPQGVGKSSGSTAVAALLTGGQLVVANTGDSRCVLCRGGEAVAMSEDHQPELPEERERIERAGGVVSDVGRVNNGLNMSRAIGDHGYKLNEDLPADEQMIIAKPDIRIETIGAADEFMILACDGIWNCMSNEECVKFVRKRLLKRGADTCLSKICEEVCDDCLAPDISGDGTGSDNMTMMIVLLKKDFAPAPVRRRKGRQSPVSEDEAADSPAPARKRSKRTR
eukprot:scpid33701/ scgid8987/ Probable protein phosphatase CG10417